VGVWRRTGTNSIRVDEWPVGGGQSTWSFIKIKGFLNGLIDDDGPKKRKTRKSNDDEQDDDSKSTKSSKSTKKKMSGIISEWKPYEGGETDTKLGVNITFVDGFLDKSLKENKNYAFEKSMGLAVNISTTNMHLFHNGKIKKYETPLEIIDDYYNARYAMYKTRKDHILNQLKH